MLGDEFFVSCSHECVEWLCILLGQGVIREAE